MRFSSYVRCGAGATLLMKDAAVLWFNITDAPKLAEVFCWICGPRAFLRVGLAEHGLRRRYSIVAQALTYTSKWRTSERLVQCLPSLQTLTLTVHPTLVHLAAVTVAYPAPIAVAANFARRGSCHPPAESTHQQWAGP